MVKIRVVVRGVAKYLVSLAALFALCGLVLVNEAEAAGFIAAHDMSTARFQHSATLLPDGKVLVLVAGGFDPNAPRAVATAEGKCELR